MPKRFTELYFFCVRLQAFSALNFWHSLTLCFEYGTQRMCNENNEHDDDRPSNAPRFNAPSQSTAAVAAATTTVVAVVVAFCTSSANISVFICLIHLLILKYTCWATAPCISTVINQNKRNNNNNDVHL